MSNTSNNYSDLIKQGVKDLYMQNLTIKESFEAPIKSSSKQLIMQQGH